MSMTLSVPTVSFFFFSTRLKNARGLFQKKFSWPCWKDFAIYWYMYFL